MTTVWRPRVRIAVPDIDGADADENRRDESTKKGTKRKRAPRHYGPCEHGVKTSLEVQGVQRLVRTVVSALSARSAVGINLRARSSSALSARSAVGHQSASTVVCALSARSAVGHKYASTVVERSQCKECGGSQICEHGRERSHARSAVGHKSASTVVCALVQGVRWVINLRARSSSAIDARSAVEGISTRLPAGCRGETVVVVVFSIYYKQYTSRLGLYFLPGVDLVGGLLRVEVLVSLAALGFAGVDFFAGFFAGVVAFLGVDFLPAFFSATAP